MCYLLMLSTLLPPINSNQPERMWAGQEIQSSLCNTCLSFIQNELRPMPGRALHGSEMQLLGGFLAVAEQWFPKTLQDRHADTWHVAQSLWGHGWPPWCQWQTGHGWKIHTSIPATLRCVGRKIFHCWHMYGWELMLVFTYVAQVQELEEPLLLTC